MIINTEEWASISEASEITSKSRQTIINWNNSGLIGSIMVGNQKFYRKSELLMAIQHNIPGRKGSFNKLCAIQNLHK